ncbi:PLP-dependent aminotransferase family protein [Aquabacterium sp.]|uniref:MocR-like pyridoxine biosynthesis transcription factor PdxR n=1 Tax=Aquabacterium sp. TaxID=1872578 RepID=UPI0035AEA923
MRAIPLGELLLTRLDDPEHAGLPAHRRVFEAIRQAILRQELPLGAKLPSTRDLASELRVSRNTVLSAYDQLLAEGYVESRTGSGTYVADTLTSDFPAADAPRAASGRRQPARLSERGQRLTGFASERHYELQEFVAGANDFSGFPLELWAKLQARHWKRREPEMLDYSRDGGHAPLREALADYLRISRSVQTTPEQILITGGTQQSIDLCARLLADPGDVAWIENPGYWAAKRLFDANGLQLHPVAVDAEGIAPDAADWQTRPRLIYVTPSHQYPCDVVMSLQRRRAVVDFAARTGAWILEDDYDSEFRYAGRPVASLQGLDRHGRVIYMGTFSKILYPGIRVGYLVVPPELVEPMRVGLTDLHRPGQMPVQAALADFIRQGHFASHIRTLRQRYGRSRAMLQQTLQQALRPEATLSSADTGLHLVIGLPASCPDTPLCAEAARQGLDVRPLSAYYMGPPRRQGLVVGFGYTPLDQVETHAGELARLVNAALRNTARGG